MAPEGGSIRLWFAPSWRFDRRHRDRQTPPGFVACSARTKILWRRRGVRRVLAAKSSVRSRAASTRRDRLEW